MAKPSISIEDLQREYLANEAKFSTLCNEIERQLSKIISQENIQLAFPIQSRLKKWTSIIDKIEQGRFNVKKSILELQDISGLRVITLFRRDSDNIARLITKKFKCIDEYKTEDKLDDNQFGYSSIHQIIEIPKQWEQIPTFENLIGLKVEIQIRTVAQHAWAEASNLLQYKQEASVPKQLKRSISRMSALLETIDLEFERTLLERENYRDSEINVNNDSELLNVDLLEKILNQKLPPENKTENEEYSDLLNDLNRLGFNTVGELNELIETQLNPILLEQKKICKHMLTDYRGIGSLSYDGYVAEDIDKIQNGIFFAHTGLTRRMISRRFGMPKYDAVLRR